LDREKQLDGEKENDPGGGGSKAKERGEPVSHEEGTDLFHQRYEKATKLNVKREYYYKGTRR